MKIMRLYFIPAGIIMLLAGCATPRSIPEIRADHPAHASVTSGKTVSAPEGLLLHLRLPDAAPSDSAVERDHMQQLGHGGGMMDMMHPGDPPKEHHHENEAGILPAPDGGKQAPPAWRCPRHPEEASPYQGNCPQCNTPFEAIPGVTPAAPPGTTGTATAPEIGYYCTVHPQVRREKPGFCPECGMTLISAKEEM
jgi:hypothetical protein